MRKIAFKLQQESNFQMIHCKSSLLILCYPHTNMGIMNISIMILLMKIPLIFTIHLFKLKNENVCGRNS